MNTVDDVVTLYNATLTHIIDTVAPLTTRTAKKDQNCPWYTLELRFLNSACRKLERKWRSSVLTVHREIWTNHLVSYRRALATARVKHFSEIITMRHGKPNILFQTIDQILHPATDRYNSRSSSCLTCHDFSSFFRNKIDIYSTLSHHKPSLLLDHLDAPPVAPLALSSFSLSIADVYGLLLKSTTATCRLDPWATNLPRCHLRRRRQGDCSSPRAQPPRLQLVRGPPPDALELAAPPLLGRCRDRSGVVELNSKTSQFMEVMMGQQSFLMSLANAVPRTPEQLTGPVANQPVAPLQPPLAVSLPLHPQKDWDIDAISRDASDILEGDSIEAEAALLRDLPECPFAALRSELGTLSQLLVKLAQLNAWAQGRSIASMVVARRQLWLSQARVQEPDKAPLLDALITPGHTFGLAVEEMLQRSIKAQEASLQMAKM
ncbi:UNVERIFIED_CONTAM: hypothetical protein FKN15_065723 [Acipenser sinensis]